MNRLLLLTAALALGLPPVLADDYVDDLYYNPKKDKTEASKSQKQAPRSNYIADFENMDVDEYNLRGQYYATPIDTIGAATESGEDFVYTQKIQKFYNPTIVVDNADVLEDVLYNAYGNVNIEFNLNGTPYFAPLLAYDWGPYLGLNFGWGGWTWSYAWGPSWTWGSPWSWGPSYTWAWNWGPAWGWGPSWTWGWGPSWGWGWEPSWAWGPSWNYRPGTDWHRPGGRGPVGPNRDWAYNTRPTHVTNGYAGNHRYSGSSRPGLATPAYSSNSSAVGSTNHHRQSGVDLNGTRTGYGSGNRVSGQMGTYQGGQTTNRTVQSDGHRRSGSNSGIFNSGTNRGSSVGTSGSGSYNSGTTNNHRSSGSNSGSTYNSGSSRGSSYNSGSSRGSSYSSGSSRGSYNSSGRSSGGGASRSSGGGRSSGGARGGRR